MLGRSATALLFAIALVAVVERPAMAQLHWDAAAQAGVMKRFLSKRTGDDAGFGPTAQLTGHVALFPLVHVGGYFGHDISPLGGDAAARDITFGGARLKGILPWVQTPFRAWAFVGFGYAGVYSRSYGTSFAIPDGLGNVTRTRVHVEGAGGGFFEVPFGLGASYRFFKPWELCVELGARVGFAHSGSVYEEPGPQVTIGGESTASQNASPAGLDRFGLGLTVGILLDL